MKKVNLNKKSTEFGTYHEHENEINSSYDSLGDYNNNQESNQKSNEHSDSSNKKEECYTGNCHTKTRNQKSNR